MTTVSSAVLRDHLSDYLERARSGEQVVVLRDGKPVAALGPVPTISEVDQNAILARMAAQGLVILPKKRSGQAFRGKPIVSPGKLASEMAIEDRR